MTNLSYQNNDTEIVCYIGKNEFKPNGLCASENNTVEIEINDESEKDREYLENLYKNHYVEYNLNGDVDITTYICPNGYKCNAEEITAYMLKENQDAVECLVCMPGCDEQQGKEEKDGGLKESFRSIIDLINNARATHPDECSGDMLHEDSNIDKAAQWKAQDFIDNNYYSHTDHLGRDPGQMLRDFGVQWTASGENIAWIELVDSEMTDDEITKKFFDMWMNSPHHRQNIMNKYYNAIGIGIVKQEHVNEQGQYITKIYAVNDFAQIEEINETQAIKKPTFNCDGKCVKKIKWWQEYDEVDIWEGLQSTTKRVPKPYIDMAIEIPKGLICAIEKVELKFEISPCRAYLEARKEPQPIPKDNEIKYTIEDGIVDGIWTVRYRLEHLSCLVPGEWIAAYAYLKGYDGCNPLLIGWNWFETQCWTSAIVQGCGLIDENGNITEGGYLEDFNDNWAGDEKLHWLVYFKGSLFWIKSSDFARYNIGDRVFIHKDGLSQYRDNQNNLEQEPACRWPVGIGGVGKDVILDDSNVDYLIDKEKDIIIPQHFFGIGG